PRQPRLVEVIRGQRSYTSRRCARGRRVLCWRVLPACHIESQLVLRKTLGFRHENQAPAVHHRDAVAESKKFGKLGTDQENRYPTRTQSSRLCMEERDRTESSSARRLPDHPNGRAPRDFPRDKDLPLVATATRLCRSVWFGRTHIVFL